MKMRHILHRKQYAAFCLSLLFGTMLLMNGTMSFAEKESASSCKPAPIINLTTIREGWNESRGQRFSYKMVMKIKNGQVRLIRGEDGSLGTIITAKGDHIQLMGPTGYLKQSASDIKRQRESFENIPADIRKTMNQNIAKKIPENLSKTDRTRMIDGLRAKLYIGNSADGNTSFEVWVTTEIEDLELVKKAQYCANQKINILTPNYSDFMNELPGIVLESVSKENDKETSQSRLVSITRDPIPDEEFQVPEGAKPMQSIFQ